jgi:TRAP-type C4-dicarboxylate transport system substrate-binding protein
MKKLFVTLFASIFSISLLIADSNAAEKNSWKIGHVRPSGSAIDKDTQRLVEKISKETSGQISFEIYPENRLGDYTIVQERCALGEVQMYIGPFGTLVDKKVALAFTPFLVKNWTEAKQVYSPNSVMMKAMDALLEKQNIKILGGWPVYFGGIVLTKEAPGLKDPNVSKNVIIRVPPIPSFELTAKMLGYTPYPITWSYARDGLKTGMVSGMIGGGAEGYKGLKQLAKYYLHVKDHFEYWFVYMNLDLWRSLSDDQKNIIQDAVREMESRRYAVAEADEADNLKKLAEQGTQVITFNDEEFSKMRNKARQTVWPMMQKEIGEAFIEVTSMIQDE